MEESSQAQSTNLPHGQGNQGGQLLQVDEEVNHPCLNHGGRQRDWEVDQANSTPLTTEIEQTAPQKTFSTPSFTHFKGDSDPESHLKHFKSIMIFYKANDVLMCKVFAMTLLGVAQDWLHTLPSGSISSFEELVYVFNKEYTFYRTIKKNPDHLFNLQKKHDESLRDYIKRFKAERQTSLDVTTKSRHRPSRGACQLSDDDRTAAKKAAKQADQPVKQASQRNDMIKDKDRGKRGLQPQRGALIADNHTMSTVPIHQILAQVKNKHWLKKPSPLKGNPAKKDTSRYCEFHEGHNHYTNDGFAWKKHLEELIGDCHCTEFIAKGAIQ
ncbi:uncharacterized protein LOC117612560 [Prunus dulcis]|uniref:uncharacterized protein LOC117612560 n=1 Tax=Prunus dulcis TaxID=3755 RepID=UPI0014823133|nr:uncharacterized protein LOC117612560 [Prunus dulcis]